MMIADWTALVEPAATKASDFLSSDTRSNRCAQDLFFVPHQVLA